MNSSLNRFSVGRVLGATTVSLREQICSHTPLRRLPSPQLHQHISVCVSVPLHLIQRLHFKSRRAEVPNVARQLVHRLSAERARSRRWWPDGELWDSSCDHAQRGTGPTQSTEQEDQLSVNLLCVVLQHQSVEFYLQREKNAPQSERL